MSHFATLISYIESKKTQINFTSKKMAMGEMYAQVGSSIAGLMVAWAFIDKYLSTYLSFSFRKYVKKLERFFNPYLQITFHELDDSGERYLRNKSDAYTAIENYLSTNSTKNARKLKANSVKNSQSPVFSMDDFEEVTDSFNGVQVWWTSNKIVSNSQSINLYPGDDEKRFYRLTLHKRDREIITGCYVDHVLKEGKEIELKNRKRKLFTNNPSQSWSNWKATKWSHMVFEHPASFDTLAMGSTKKEEIKKDLIKFSKGKDYYAKIGKAWKRGYLLYGPPGTGKSTMIAAMANLLDYDVYDLELTTVKNNSDLRKLLIDTTGKSIIVIEDIDCSLDLTGQRKKKEKDDDKDEKEKDPVSKLKKEIGEESKSSSEVTLSGLLNFIDGLWSACGGERIIVFTTNFVDKLDPALIRRGRMDKHIEMGYCCFEAFKELAKNYLDVEFHELYPKIEKLLGETNITPADVAENLMLKSDEKDEEIYFKNLIEVLEAAKEEDARKKAEEEEKKKKAEEEEEEEKRKAEEEAEKGTVASAEEVKENGVMSHGQEE